MANYKYDPIDDEIKVGDSTLSQKIQLAQIFDDVKVHTNL